MLNQLLTSRYSSANWILDNPLHPQLANEAAVDWIFLIDLLNFSFWSENTGTAREYSVTYQVKRYTGYWTLCACIRRALDEGLAITSPAFFGNVSDETMRHVFRADDLLIQDPIPLFDERLRCMHEAGAVLLDKFNGSFVNCITQANGSCQKLLEIILDNFSVFQDSNEYRGNVVHFCKRAQILVADVWACFEGKGLGFFHDIDQITMFADYRVPQALIAIGALEYSQELTEFLKSGVTMEVGDERESEIRACSIWAVELMKRNIITMITERGIKNTEVNSILVDFYLWDYAKARSSALKHIPVHRTRSNRY